MLRRMLWSTLALVLFLPILIYVQPVRAGYKSGLAVSVSPPIPSSPSYLAPKPNAPLVSPYTTLAIRYNVPFNPASKASAHFAVSGSKSGVHTGRTTLSDDLQTLLFIPDKPFQLNEVVNVAFALDNADAAVTYQFTTSTTNPAHMTASNLAVALADEAQTQAAQLISASSSTFLQASKVVTENTVYHTIPKDFPQITVTTPAAGVDNGYLFLSNFQFSSCPINAYLLILDNNTAPIFYRPLTSCLFATDFKRQPNGMLTYWESTGIFHVLDNSYTEVNTFQAGHGYSTDNHELHILPNNHALLMSYDSQVISNTNQIIPNGRITATVVGLIVQELDATKNVVFEWRSWDHFQITDTTDIYLHSEPVDYVHGNALELDTDGNLLLSSRHLNEITKINRQTGAIIWRLGGKHNQFTFVGDNRAFSHQHDIRRLPNGNITLFDNGNLATPPYARAVEYRLDEKKKIATLVHEYRNTPDTVALAMGSNQRLTNSNVLVGWGLSSNPAITEFGQDGTKHFELALSPTTLNYRAFRFNWQGYPTTDPTLVIVTDTVPTLYYSWNGATEILGYRVYGGTTNAPDTLIDTTFKTGFETKTVLGSAVNQACFYRVMPIDKHGQTTRYSNTVFLDSPACRPPATLPPQPTETPVPTAPPQPTETPVPTAPPQLPGNDDPNATEATNAIFLPFVEH